ncbi:MAG: hypothetical protein DVB23_000594 [Verrucomicrobia bacterium]|nr:MAG: hypothetical protein DVB23_000594 [Verrucomicrobiota bacterium]
MDLFASGTPPDGDSAEANYSRELIDAIWREADGIEGNDPELWRKDEYGAWIYRLDYGRPGSNFGWQIAPRGRDLRPLHWQNAGAMESPPAREDDQDTFDLFS